MKKRYRLAFFVCRHSFKSSLCLNVFNEQRIVFIVIFTGSETVPYRTATTAAIGTAMEQRTSVAHIAFCRACRREKRSATVPVTRCGCCTLSAPLGVQLRRFSLDMLTTLSFPMIVWALRYSKDLDARNKHRMSAFYIVLKFVKLLLLTSG